MSVIEDLGARVRAASDDLPVGLVIEALDKLKLAADRLQWVRQESADPMGVPELAAATEHAETAGHVLRVAQEQLAAYLAAIGLGRDGGTTATDRERSDGDRSAPPLAGATGARRRTAGAAPPWWAARVSELTGGSADAETPAPDRDITDAQELLRRIAGRVRTGDRGQLAEELRRADANIGLGLAAVAPPILRDLATELLGHRPRAQDLPRLRREVGGQVRDLLPNLPPAVLDTLLSRVCRMPPPKEGEQSEQPHPADPAVASGVLTGLLLHRLGHDERSVTPRQSGSDPGQPYRAPRERRRNA